MYCIECANMLGVNLVQLGIRTANKKVKDQANEGENKYESHPEQFAASAAITFQYLYDNEQPKE